MCGANSAVYRQYTCPSIKSWVISEHFFISMMVLERKMGQDVRLLRRDRSIENKGVFWGVFRDGGIQPNRYSDLASHIQMR